VATLNRIIDSAFLKLKSAWAFFRTGDVCLPVPVFITVDDCGFPRVYPQNPQTPPVGYETYGCLLTLAKKYATRIALAFTTRYLDKSNISGKAQPLTYLDRLMELLVRNQQYLEIANHGWIHDQKDHAGEFYLLDINKPAPSELQEESIKKSSLIYQSWGLDFPRVFTPPYNAFTPGVTDRILFRYGCRYIISTPSLHANKYSPVWLDYSSGMCFGADDTTPLLPRSWLGILAIHTNLNGMSLNSVKRELVMGYRRGRPLNPARMTHIGNFLPQNLPFWEEAFQYVEESPFLYFPRDVAQAASQWLFLKYGSFRLKKQGWSTILLLNMSRMPSFHEGDTNQLAIKMKRCMKSAFLNGRRLSLHQRGNFNFAYVPFKKEAQEVVLE
jgi:hypothetical protein